MKRAMVNIWITEKCTTEPVLGWLVPIPELPELMFVVGKYGGTWRVTETQTGCYLGGIRPTRRKALASCAKAVREVSADVIRKKVTEILNKRAIGLLKE